MSGCGTAGYARESDLVADISRFHYNPDDVPLTMEARADKDKETGENGAGESELTPNHNRDDVSLTMKASANYAQEDVQRGDGIEKTWSSLNVDGGEAYVFVG